MNNLKQIFGGNLRQFGMIFALIALILFFQIATGGKVLTPVNMQNLISGNAYVLIMAIGMVMVIIAGHIDLSVGSVAAFVGITVAVSTYQGEINGVQGWGLPWWAGLMIGVFLGILVGVWQGTWVAYVGIPAFIVTLAGMLLFRGMQQIVGNSASVPVPAEIKFLGSGYLPEWGPDTGFNNSTLLLGILGIAAVIFFQLRSRSKSVKMGATVPPMGIIIVRIVAISLVIAYATVLFGTGNPGTSFPVPGVILLVLVIIYTFITTKTVLGRHIYAVGGNKHAAELSGVKSRGVNFWVMANMSFLASIAAIVATGRSGASGPLDGTGWELDAIAAVFIGGAAVSGGVGTVTGSVIGGLVMATLTNGLNLIGADAKVTQVVKGLVLILAVAVDVLNKQQGRPSIIGHLTKNARRDKDQNDTKAPTAKA